MAIEVNAPQYPESIEDGTLMTWHKQPGEAVKRDEKLADIETDKVVLEVVATAAGVLTSHAKQPGDIVLAKEVIGTIDTEGTASVATPSPEPKVTTPPAAPPPTVTASVPPLAKPEPVAESVEDAVLSPAVRKMVDEHNIPLANLTGSGRDGRITKGDVLSYLERNERGAATAIPSSLEREVLPERLPKIPPRFLQNLSPNLFPKLCHGLLKRLLR